MLFAFFGSLLNSTVVYAYPSYASFKSLSRRPASEQDLERWLMYWSVVGCIVALEYVAEWTVSWIPLYRLLKTIFLLWLALPQTQGATYIYHTRLAPFLTIYEPTIDSYLSQYKAKLYSFIQDQLRAAWRHISGLIAQQTGINLNNVDPSATPTTGAAQGFGGQGNATNSADNLNQTAQVVLGLWRTWGPTIVNALRPPTAPESGQQQAQAAPTLTVPSRRPASRPTSSSQSSGRNNPDLDTIRARRREVEAELARLTALENEGALPKVPSLASNVGQSMYLSDAASVSEASFGTDGRNAGRYEEISKDDVSEGSDEGNNNSSRPTPPARWSFWGRSSSGYTPVKED